MKTGAAFAVYAAASYAVLQRINDVVPEPYMDEIFHVLQAQRYCAGEFYEWDPKLTTPPGLYLASLVLRLCGLSCSVPNLRLVNWVLGLGLFWTIYRLVHRLHSSSTCAAAATMMLAMLPVPFFCNHLYYTDTASLLCVLLTYLLSLQQRHTAAAVVGGLSLWMRQTNVVWVALIGASAALHLHAREIISARNALSLQQSVVQLSGWATRWSNWRKSAAVWAPYAAVVALFGGFVMANGGIVLGDKQHHQAGLHLPQLFYFYAYTCVLSMPTVALALSRLAHSIRQRSKCAIVGCVAVVAIMAVCVKYFTVEHPFLLSDNRHYPFYIWKNLFRRHWTLRFLAIPFYLAAGHLVHASMRTYASPLWQLMWAACTAAVLVPSPLLEFRYFTVPFFLARLHMPLSSVRLIAIEFALFVLTNAVTIWVFLYRPFKWDSEPNSWQRFMW
ncbi:glucosyltransferase [Coemansia sp. RSA 1250]|nr:glucosyltransferase [Coemansia sp. RSA 1250]